MIFSTCKIYGLINDIFDAYGLLDYIYNNFTTHNITLVELYIHMLSLVILRRLHFLQGILYQLRASIDDLIIGYHFAV